MQGRSTNYANLLPFPGFGQVVPVTFFGRLFCILCALIGIPLNAVILKNVGEQITHLICSVIRYAEMRMCGRQEPAKVGLKAAVVSFVVMVIFLLVGGALDMIFDGWTFFDGVYFTFIALSTIGFGDLFPRVETASKLDKLGLGENGKRIFASSIMLIFMIIGLSVVSTVVCSILNAIEEMSQVPARIKQKSVLRQKEKTVMLKSIREKSREEPNIGVTLAEDCETVEKCDAQPSIVVTLAEE